MLDRKVARELLDEELQENKIPKNVFKEELVRTFRKYVKDNYYEWLKDNFKLFFNYGNPNWQWTRKRIKKHGEWKKELKLLKEKKNNRRNNEIATFPVVTLMTERDRFPAPKGTTKRNEDVMDGSVDGFIVIK